MARVIWAGHLCKTHMAVRQIISSHRHTFPASELEPRLWQDFSNINHAKWWYIVKSHFTKSYYGVVYIAEVNKNRHSNNSNKNKYHLHNSCVTLLLRRYEQISTHLI